MIIYSKQLPKPQSILKGKAMLKTLAITVMMASTAVNAAVNDFTNQTLSHQKRKLFVNS